MKKFFRIFLFVLIGAVVLGTFYFLWKKSRPVEVVYEIVEVATNSIQNTSVATGKVSPRDEIMIKPQIQGIISELRKEAGDFVTEGEVIAVVKVIPDMSQLNSAESRVRIAEIAIETTRAAHERQVKLFAGEVISREEMEQSEAEYRRAVEELQNSKDALDIVREGSSKNTSDIANTQIRSTITGMIINIPVKVGNSVMQASTFSEGTTIATVADMSDLIFIGNVDETEVGRVHTGMPVKLTIGAVENSTFDADLEYISPQGVEQNGAILFEIKAAATIPDSVNIRAGYSANAEIVLARVEDVITVPESTVSFSGDSTFVYVLTDSLAKKQVFERRDIKTGLSNGMIIEVTEGLAVGQKIRGNQITAVAMTPSVPQQ
ncbi:MAG: efflux RND transporter periplasmic adaptor subunit [Alistipes sp.]|jgi:HlyD family secretion protein|nr:efflux RND transporter periplasmic adaptor subunit [Alistipes sp.]